MKANSVVVTLDVLASKNIRFANLVIDYIVRFVIGFSLAILISLLSELTGNYRLYDFLIASDSRMSDYVFGIIILVIYYVVIEGFTSRSIGKYITKTKIVTHEGLSPDFGAIFLRTLCRLIPFNAFSFLGKEGKGWHDSISNTYVVDVKKFEDKQREVFELNQLGKAQE